MLRCGRAASAVDGDFVDQQRGREDGLCVGLAGPCSANGEVEQQEERLIEDGINAVMKLDVADRSLSALRSMLGMKDSSGVGARLEKWTSEGSLGWVFDNPADSMTLDARWLRPCGPKEKPGAIVR